MKRQQTLLYETFASRDELGEADRQLLCEAERSAQKAYAPYSGFHVGAAILLEDGSIVCGNNQENASYPQGLCAERTALFAASAQFPEKRIRAIALTAIESAEPLSPCGGCRQVLLEYEQRQRSPIRIVMGSAGGSAIIVPEAAGLLPLCFSKENLSETSPRPQ